MVVEEFSALCRRDNKTEICSACGQDEGMFDYFLREKKDEELICNIAVTALIPVKAMKELERSWLST